MIFLKDKIRRITNKNTIAYNRIKEMILNNEFKCGEIISENSLAAKLEMSRTPIREAILALYNEGYVEIHKGVGVLVKYVTLKEVYDINAVRVVLEKFAVRNAVNEIQTYQLDNLILRWNKLKDRISQGKEYEPRELFDLDEETHSLFIDYSANDFFKNLIDNMQSKIHRYQKMFTTIIHDDINTINQHIGILEAIKEKDVDIACDLLEKHIYSPLTRMYESNKLDLF